MPLRARSEAATSSGLRRHSTTPTPGTRSIQKGSTGAIRGSFHAHAPWAASSASTGRASSRAVSSPGWSRSADGEHRRAVPRRRRAVGTGRRWRRPARRARRSRRGCRAPTGSGRRGDRGRARALAPPGRSSRSLPRCIPVIASGRVMPEPPGSDGRAGPVRCIPHARSTAPSPATTSAAGRGDRAPAGRRRRRRRRASPSAPGAARGAGRRRGCARWSSVRRVSRTEPTMRPSWSSQPVTGRTTTPWRRSRPTTPRRAPGGDRRLERHGPARSSRAGGGTSSRGAEVLVGCRRGAASAPTTARAAAAGGATPTVARNPAVPPLRGAVAVTAS